MHFPQIVPSAVVVLLLATPLAAQDTRAGAVIWHDRGDIAALDLTTGPRGRSREPGTDFRFIEESDGGTSPKFVVEDEYGVRWKVKLGSEAKSETAAARLLWAAGYVVDEDYYRTEIHVRELTRLARGQQFVSGNTITGARLERDTPDPESTTWSWYDNPFVGTREFNGLRVMMALVNNWDLKAVNNHSSNIPAGGGQYSVADLGATFGRTGNNFGRSKGIATDYAAAGFIDKVTPTHVDFIMRSRPFFLSVINIGNYRFRTRMERIARQVPVADALWIGERLGRLSARQLRDCFRAAGFSPAEVEAYTESVTLRIAALNALDRRLPDLPVLAKTRAHRCLESTCRQAPLRETLTAIGLGNPYARGIIGGFQQGAGIGGGLQLTTAGLMPAVEIRGTALTSTRRYERLDLEAFLPNLGGSRNHADVWYSYQRRDTDFFGIGPRTAPEAETAFAITRRSVQASLYRDLTTHLQGGVYGQVMDADAVLDTATTATRILSYGAFLAYDTRDDSIGLTRGLDLYGRVASADGLRRHGAPTDDGWIDTDIDLRAFAPLGSHRTSLLLRSRGQFKTPRGGDQIPFYELSWLGGREHLRGYPSYRFRGNHAVLLSSEIQRTVHAMTPVRGLDLFASADTGQVWSGSDFDARHWHSGLGGGLQYRHSRGLAVRIEVSRSQELTRVYYAMSRGF